MTIDVIDTEVGATTVRCPSCRQRVKVAVLLKHVGAFEVECCGKAVALSWDGKALTFQGQGNVKG